MFRGGGDKNWIVMKKGQLVKISAKIVQKTCIGALTVVVVVVVVVVEVVVVVVVVVVVPPPETIHVTLAH